jgi:hypothetical protein
MIVTIDLPDDGLARLRSEATRRGVSIDTVIAELAGQLPSSSPSKRRLSFAGTLYAEPELAARAEDILSQMSRQTAG